MLTEDGDGKCVNAEFLEEDMAEEEYDNGGCGWRYIEQVCFCRTSEPFNAGPKREKATIAATLETKTNLDHRSQ